MDIWNYDLHIVFHTAEFSPNSLGEFVAFWNYDFHTVFHTSQVSTNSLADFVVFWKYDFHIVFNTTELSINSLVYFVVLWERRVGRKPARGLGWQQVRARARYKFKV